MAYPSPAPARHRPRAGRKATRSLLLAALLGLSTAAAAQPGPMFDKMDRNGDGAIDGEEARAMREKAFARMDSDGDGTVTQAEIEQRRQNVRQGADAMFSKADSNGDGALSKEEFLAFPGMLGRADSDGDGVVTADEAAALRKQMEARRNQPQ